MDELRYAAYAIQENTLTAMKEWALLFYTATQMRLINTLLNERSTTQKKPYCIVPLLDSPTSGKVNLQCLKLGEHSSGKKSGIGVRRAKDNFWDARSFLLLHLGGGYAGMFSLQEFMKQHALSEGRGRTGGEGRMQSKTFLDLPRYTVLALESRTCFIYSKNKFNKKKRMYRCMH